MPIIRDKKIPQEVMDSINLMAQGKIDYTVEAFSINTEEHGMMMVIPVEEGCIYVTKQDAIEFWGLKDAN